MWRGQDVTALEVCYLDDNINNIIETIWSLVRCLMRHGRDGDDVIVLVPRDMVLEFQSPGAPIDLSLVMTSAYTEALVAETATLLGENFSLSHFEILGQQTK